MPQCFIIQPFDGSEFDRRFDEVIKPAIEKAGLNTYRVDRDPRATIPIDQIAEQIRASDICVADISLDNPNVWFEVGYAAACDKPLLLLSLEKKRRHFPFDIQHRWVITYRTASSGDFARLAQDITTRLTALFPSAARVAAEKVKASAAVAVTTIRDAASVTASETLADERVQEVARIARDKAKDLVKGLVTKYARTAAESLKSVDEAKVATVLAGVAAAVIAKTSGKRKPKRITPRKAKPSRRK